MLNKAGKKKYIWMVICFSLAFIIGIVTVLMCVLPKGEKEKNIEITEIFYDSNNASDVENSKISRKSETSVNCKIVLGSEIESSITYSIKINNQTNYNYYFDGVKYDGAENYSNEDISFEVNELKRYDVVKSKSSIVLKITFSYLGTIVPENKTLVAVLDFKFERTKELNELIKLDNTLITTDPTLTDVSNNTTDFNGLYKSTETDNGKPTYYFRGSVSNNYVSFAGFLWKIIRINEDGTIRLILTEGEKLSFNEDNSTYGKMYYSNNSEAKAHIDNWYKTNILDKNYDSYVATSKFCEAARVKKDEEYTADKATMQLYTDYTPNFKYVNDENGFGLLKSKVGLITYDELVFAGGYPGKDNSTNYLYMGGGFWTMSPAGFGSVATLWCVRTQINLEPRHTVYGYSLRPVISLNAELHATGNGTVLNPYSIIVD